MNQENKQLLLQDLCARLPYGVKCKIGNFDYIICYISYEKPYKVIYQSGRDFPIGVIGTEYNGTTFYVDVSEEHVKPCLFPLSSMTEEQLNELKEYSGLKYSASLLELVSWTDTHSTLEFWLEETPSYVVIKVFDWLNKNHFDYRGLIEKGLAIDATGLNVY